MNKSDLPVFFTIYTSSAGSLSKTYTLENNTIVKTPSAQMYIGTAERSVMEFKAFKNQFLEATDKQAFGYGLHLKKYTDEVNIVVSGKEEPENNIISRTKKYFKYRKKPGILMIDHDPSDYGSTLTSEDLIDILGAIDPEIKQAARIVRGSVSAGVCLTGRKPKNNKGFHIYIPVKDASDIPDYGKRLFDYLWLNGHGYIALAANGALLVRTPIDDAVFSGERLDFVGQPIINDERLQYITPKVDYSPGSYLDTSILPKPTDKEARKIKTLIANAKQSIRSRSLKKAKEYQNNKIANIIGETGVSFAEATAFVKKIVKGNCRKLWGSWILEFPECDVTVADVLDNYKNYNGKVLADPIEGRAYGKTTSKFWWNDGKPTIHSFAHGQNITYFLSKEEPKRYIEGVKAHYPLPHYVSKEEACVEIEEAVKKWVKNPTGSVALVAPAGIGKTKIILKSIASVATDNFVEYYVPTHKLAQEIKQTLLSFNPCLNVVVIQGRNYSDGDCDALCADANFIRSIQEYGYNIYKDVCQECRFFDGCGYLGQFDSGSNVRIFTHASLAIPRGFLDSKHPDMAIIDESFFSVMIDNKYTTLEDIKYFITNKLLANTIAKALSDGMPLLLKLRKVFDDDNLITVLKDAYNLVKPTLPSIETVRNSSNNSQPFSNIKQRQILALMLKQLQAEITQFPKRNHSTTVRLVNDTDVVIANRNKLQRFIISDYVAEDKYLPVMCIDADFSLEVAKVFLPGIRKKTISVERNAHITQIYSTTNAKTRITPRVNSKEGSAEKKAAANHVRNIQRIVDNIYQDYGPALIISYQDLVGNPKNNIESKLALPDGCECVHFGALRGLNEFGGFDVAIVIGRNQLPVSVLESQAAAIWWDNKKQLVLTGKYYSEVRGYRFREPNKMLGVNVLICDDPRTQALQQLQRECESLQAIDRLRLIHNKKIKYVFLLSNVPLDVTVDHLISFKNLTRWRSKIETALLKAPHGVLLLNAEYLIQEYPNLFKNDNTVKNEIRSNRLGGVLQYFLPKKIPIMFNGIRYNVIVYRVIGSRGGDRKALIPGKMTSSIAMYHIRKMFPGQRVKLLDSTGFNSFSRAIINPSDVELD